MTATQKKINTFFTGVAKKTRNLFTGIKEAFKSCGGSKTSDDKICQEKKPDNEETRPEVGDEKNIVLIPQPSRSLEQTFKLKAQVNTNKWRKYKEPIYQLLAVGDETWAVTQNSLKILRPVEDEMGRFHDLGESKSKEFSTPLVGACVTKYGYIVVATGRGLYLHDTNGVQISKMDRGVYHCLTAHDNRVYAIKKINRLRIFDMKKDGKFRKTKLQMELTHHDLITMGVAQGIIWVANESVVAGFKDGIFVKELGVEALGDLKKPRITGSDGKYLMIATEGYPWLQVLDPTQNNTAKALYSNFDEGDRVFSTVDRHDPTVFPTAWYRYRKEKKAED